MRCILLLAMVVVSASGQKPCCAPEQFEGLISAAVGYATPQGQPGVEVMSGTFSADYKNNMVFAREYFAKQMLNLTVLQDFNKNIQYMMYPENKTCIQQPLPSGSPNGRCIPDSAMYAGRFTYGLDAFAYDIFSFTQAGATIAEGVTIDTCVPIFFTVETVTPEQTSIFENLAYNNITLGIKDPSVFKLPSYCNSIAKTNIFGLDIGSQMRAFPKLFKI